MILLKIETFKKLKELKSKKADILYINKCYAMMQALMSITFFYSLNVITRMETFENQYITGTTTTIAIIFFVCMYLYSRLTIKENKD